LGLLGGLRIESTNATYNANLVDGNDNLIGPSVNKQDYTNIFPDLNAKYQVSDDFQIRGAFTTSIARPGFNQITAAKTYDYDNDIISQGNPDLKATTADNIDLTAEYYLPNGGIAAAGLFYKSFGNYIIPTTNPDYPVSSPPFNKTTAQFNSFSDIGSAMAQGIELNYQQQFLFLPGPWSGFGFDGNFTYVDSSGDIRTGEKHALPQTSPRNFNAALFYEKYGLNLRLGASYVSTNLWAVGSDSSQDLYSQPRFRLDFGSSYTILDNYEVYFDVKNITNTKLEFTQTANSAYPVQREFYGADYLFGVRAHF
jgi:TonB-dependent receptor